MRIRLAHDTRYRFSAPARGVIQTLRLTPRNHDGQYVVRWRIDVSEDSQLSAHEDAFGNITHIFTADGPFDALTVRVEGEVETQDTHGVVRGAVERFPPSLYLRETPLTRTGPAIAEFARAVREDEGGDPLETLHTLVRRLHGDMAFDTSPTSTGTSAAEAFALRRGVCQDFTHIFIAATRALGIPARYVGGHMFRNDGVVQQEAGHAWVEAYVQNLGWVGFDPANGICPTEAHVRVAVGLDYLGAAPVRGARQGGADEKLSVAVEINQATLQRQS